MKKTEYKTLIKFFLAIIIIVIFQTILKTPIESALMPSLLEMYGINTTGVILNGPQKIIIEGAGIITMILWIISYVSGALVRDYIITLGEQLERLIITSVPNINLDIWNRNSDLGSAFSIIGLSFLLLILQILPYVIAGIYFTYYVVREGNRIRNEEAEFQARINKERYLMLSDIAHDIRNPMTTIAGYAQALDDDVVKDKEKRMEYLHAIRKKSDRIEELITLLFEYAKMNSEGFRLNKEKIDICELLRRNAALAYTDAEEKAIEIIPEIPNEPCFLEIDRVQFSRAVNNLIGNAISYNPRGTRILIKYTVDPDGWDDNKLIIADTGSMIDENTAVRLFEPFSRGDNSRSTDGGSGLGLSIVKSIIELHNGKITYCDDIEGYTKGFKIILKRTI